MLFRSQIDSGVNDLIEKVNDKVHQDDEGGKEYGSAHNDGVVPVQNALNEVPSETGNGEHLLNNEASGQDIGDKRADVGDDRDKAVPERMLKDNLSGGKTLRLCGAHIVGIDSVEQACSGHSAYVAHGIEGQSKARHYIMRRSRKARAGQQFKFDTEDN